MGVHKFQQTVGETVQQIKASKPLPAPPGSAAPKILGTPTPTLPQNRSTQMWGDQRVRKGTSLALKLVNTDMFKFQKYADETFRMVNTKTKQRYDITKRFAYSPEPLEESLKLLEPSANAQAVEISGRITKN